MAATDATGNLQHRTVLLTDIANEWRENVVTGLAAGQHVLGRLLEVANTPSNMSLRPSDGG